MASWIMVYCKGSVAHLTPAMLTEELHRADLMTLAEVFNLPEGETAAVREMWKRYRIEAPGKGIDGARLPSAEGINGVKIHWHQSMRPVGIHSGPAIPGEIEETLENLPPSKSAGARRVREHLQATREVVAFEMSGDGSNHLAATISEVLAFYAASEGDGLVWFFHREFASPDDRGGSIWKTREE